MKDHLPKKIRKRECGIINLDSSDGPGTHWTAYVKNDKSILYFDSFGNLPPPKDIIKYFNSDGVNKIQYNYISEQKFNSYNCGQLCLKFLYKACSLFISKVKCH